MKHVNKGFTLPEMILVVVVLGIFLTMVFPDITRLIQFNAEKIQEANMKELQIAVETRMKDYDAIVADGAALSNVSATLISYLDPYTKLQSNKIGQDEWGNDLLLRHREITGVTYRGVDMDVNYFAALSLGPNRTRDTSNANFPNNFNATASNYANVRAEGDDYVIKYTDYPQQVAIVDDAFKKIRAIEAKLETYAEARLAEYIDMKEMYCDDVNDAAIPGNEYNRVRTTYPGPTAADVDLLNCYSGEFSGDQRDENKIVFYPLDGYERTNGRQNVYGRLSGPNGPADPADNRQLAGFPVNIEQTASVTNTGNSGNYIANTYLSNASGPNGRRDRGRAMVRLMRLIGLPDDYCCMLDGEPMYYYSRPDADGVCTPTNEASWARPGLGAAKKPAKVTMEPSC